MIGPLLRTPEEGADTIVWLAAAPDAAGLSGLFFLDRRPRAKHRLRRTRRPDEAREAAKLWRLCTSAPPKRPGQPPDPASARVLYSRRSIRRRGSDMVEPGGDAGKRSLRSFRGLGASAILVSMPLKIHEWTGKRPYQ